MDEDTRQQEELTAMIVAGLDPEELWPDYFRDRRCPGFELNAYLHGALSLPPAERSYFAASVSAGLRRKSGKQAGRQLLLSNSGRARQRAPKPSRNDEDALAALGAAGRFLLTPERAERERLESLRETGLLHTGAERTFDGVVAAAKRFFAVRAASVSLIDKDVQFLKSAVGPLKQQTPRDIALCAETVQRNSLLVINDTLAHERFASNPLVLGEPFIRFYAGYPLHGPRGWNIGTLCIIDQKPRSFPASCWQRLRAFAHIIQHQIDTHT